MNDLKDYDGEQSINPIAGISGGAASGGFLTGIAAASTVWFLVWVGVGVVVALGAAGLLDRRLLKVKLGTLRGVLFTLVLPCAAAGYALGWLLV